MSHSMTVTRTVTSSHHEGTAFVLNTGTFKSCPGIIKLLQLLCGIITTGIMGYFMGNFVMRYSYELYRSELFFLLISVFALITTACVIISMVLSIGTAAILPRTFFEVVYHFVAFLLLCAASITLLVVHTDRGRGRAYLRSRDYEAKLAAAMVFLSGVHTTLLCVSSAMTFSDITVRNRGYRFLEPGYHSKRAAASIGLINSFLYLCTFVMAIRSWRLV